MNADTAADEALALAKRIKVLQSRMFKGAEAKALRLPPLLEKRRKEHCIPNGCFSCQPAFDHVFLYQIADEDAQGGATFIKDGVIVKPKTKEKNDRDESPRAILVAAGAQAMDALRSHGIALGHIVRFQQYIPFRYEVENIDGYMASVLNVRAGSLAGSEDLELAKRRGEIRMVWDENVQQHVWVETKTKKKRIPITSFEPADAKE